MRELFLKLNYIKEIVKLEKSPFDNHHNYFRQELPMDAKTSTCLIIKKKYLHRSNLHTKYLLFAEEKIVTLQGSNLVGTTRD